jgi:RHS repeat-associated protein
MTDSSGTVVWAADYKPFGEATVTVSTITNNLRFPGQYYDAETGLNYNYFRDYNPVIGRYVESDPIGLRGDLNLYRYVGNNPGRWIDPLGLGPKEWWEFIKNFAENFVQGANPEPIVTPVAQVLLDPNTPKTVILIKVNQYNVEQAANGTDSYIDPAWAEQHPLDALKKVIDYENEKKKQTGCPK